jgi:dihydroceramide fatty acyl 2-hydroxylase
MWSTTFQRFSTGRTPIFGALAIAVHDWACPKPGQSRMFDQELLERLTYAHPVGPLVVYAPLGVGLIWWAHAGGASFISIGAWYLAGLLAWSLLEYIIHRYSFHHDPRTRTQVAMVYLSHGVHHAYPDDSRRWVMPLLVTLPVGALLLSLVVLGLGPRALPGFAGFAHGYLTYDTLHYLIHRGPLPTSMGRFLRRHHLQHHYATPDRRFGVSSPLWDLIFRTVR